MLNILEIIELSSLFSKLVKQEIVSPHSHRIFFSNWNEVLFLAPTTPHPPWMMGSHGKESCHPLWRPPPQTLPTLISFLRLTKSAPNGSLQYIYASPTSGEAYRDRRLTTNFELCVEIFCVPTCFHVRIPKPCLSVCSYPEKKKIV